MNWTQKLLAFSSELKAAGIEPLSYSEEDGIGTLVLYGAIDEYWGVSASAVVQTLADKAPDKLIVRLNSPGGSVFEGLAIHSFLKGLKYPVEVTIDGYAASIASIIMLAASKVTASKVAMVMIHEAWTFAYGNAGELRQTADLLEKINGQLRDVYMTKTGKSAEEIEALMKVDTWFTAEEALELGLIDEVLTKDTEDGSAAAALQRKFKALLQEKNVKPDSWNPAQARLQMQISSMLQDLL